MLDNEVGLALDRHGTYLPHVRGVVQRPRGNRLLKVKRAIHKLYRCNQHRCKVSSYALPVKSGPDPFNQTRPVKF